MNAVEFGFVQSTLCQCNGVTDWGVVVLASKTTALGYGGMIGAVPSLKRQN